MKHLVLLLSLFASVALAAPPADQGGGKVWDYYDVTYQDNHCHYYRAEAASGTSETDNGRSAGTAPCAGAQTGTYAGGFSLNQTGALVGDGNKAVLYDGAAGTRMTLPLSSDWRPKATANYGWAVEFWVKTTDTAGYMVASGNTTGQFIFYTYNNAGALLVATRCSTGGCNCNHFNSSAGSGLNDGAWHHVVFATVGDGGDDFTSAKGYIDGTLVINYTGPFSGALCTTDYPGEVSSLNDSDHLIGTIDEIAFYIQTSGVGLTQAQVTNHYLAGRRSPHHGPAHVAQAQEWFLPLAFTTKMTLKDFLEEGVR